MTRELTKIALTNALKDVASVLVDHPEFDGVVVTRIGGELVVRYLDPPNPRVRERDTVGVAFGGYKISSVTGEVYLDWYCRTPQGRTSFDSGESRRDLGDDADHGSAQPALPSSK